MLTGRPGPPPPSLPSPRRTWNLIEDKSTDAVIAWSSDGKSFVVKNPAALPALLPKRAGIINETYGGFIRELDLYGFRCTRRGDDGFPAEFACDGFERGKPEKLAGVRRKGNYGRSRR